MKLIIASALLCFAATAQAGLFELALEDLNSSEREFAEELREVFTYISGDDESINDIQQGVRSRGLMSKFNQHCDCAEKNNCGCCGKVDAMGTKMNACVNVSVAADQYALQVKGKLGFLNLIDEKISIKEFEKACKSLPLFLNKIKVCIHSKTDLLNKEGDFKSCLAVEINAYKTTIAYANFKCLKYVDGTLSTTDEIMEVDPSIDPIIDITAPNPVKPIVDLIKKAKENADNDEEETDAQE